MDPEVLLDAAKRDELMEAILADPAATHAAWTRVLNTGLKAMEATDPNCLNWIKTVTDSAALDAAIALMFDHQIVKVVLYDADDSLNQAFAELLRETPKFVALARNGQPSAFEIRAKDDSDAEPVQLKAFSDCLAEIAEVQTTRSDPQ